MFGQQGQPGAKPQGGFTFGGAASGTTAGGGGFTFGGTGSSTGTGTSGFKLGTSTTASSTPASKPFSFGSGAASTPGSSFNFTGLSSSSTTTAATTAAVPTLSLGTTPGPKTSLFGATPLGSNQPSGGGFTFGAGGSSSSQVNPASSAATTSTTGASSKPSLFAAPAPQTAGSPSLRLLAGTTTSAGQGFKLGTAAPTPATGLGSTGTTGSFGLGLPKTTATSATTASNPSASSLSSLGSFGSALSSSKPVTSVSLTAQTTAQTTASITATTTTASSTPQLSYKQLEEQINKWVSNLEDYERTFLDQAAQVNAWDRLLMENGEKITELNDNVESVKAEQKRLDEELDFILAQQQELEVLLKPLEEELQKRMTGPGQLQNADREREFTYGLAKDIDGQLKQMVGDLKSIIEHLNATGSTQQENNDPIIQVAKILNAHMSSLQWIDQNAALLQRKVDEVSGLSEIRRKEQERNFRLAFD